MINNNSNFNTFLYGKKFPIEKWEEDVAINFWIKQTYKSVKCPKCGHICTSVHESHDRVIQDTPIHNKCVYINICVREFKCENNECQVKTFTEQLLFAGKNQVRTYALTEFIIIHAIYMSSNTTSLILSFMGVNVSADTVDNILKKVDIPDNPDVERIGIDDVSIRKGIKYSTAIYDLDSHHLIALLEGREKDDIIPWLKAHSKIKYVARDRASAYAEAVTEIHPNAVQVADRYHLFENITKYIKDMFYAEILDKIVIKNNEILDKKATKVESELAKIDWQIVDNFEYTNDKPVDESGNEISFIDVEYDMNDEIHSNQAKNRKEKYNKAIEIRNNSTLPTEELSKKYEISDSLVIKYLNMSDEEIEKIKEKKDYTRKETEFSKYKNIAYKMILDGQPLEYIIAYILKLGYSKTTISLKGKNYCLAKNNNINNIQFKRYSSLEYSKDETIITKRELLMYLLTLDEKKQKSQQITDNIGIIKEKYPLVGQLETLFKDFHDTIFSKDESKLDLFIDNYKEILPSFTNGLKKDITAVKNAISYEINSGFVEGNNNKFKLIKRIVYGKQKICNLFKRCFLAFSSTLDDLTLLRVAISPLINK